MHKPNTLNERNIIVAIHQPDFFPWLGFFNKIARSDILILMDNAQFSKTGGTFTNRVMVIINKQAAWLTIPIVRSYHGTRTNREMLINNTTPWRDNMLKTIQTNYGRAPFFKTLFPFLERLINNPTDSLTEYNTSIIRSLICTLGLNSSKQIYGSELSIVGHSTDLLIGMTQAVGGTTYLCGGGAVNYQEDDKFISVGLELIYQNFCHPIYPQFNTDTFIPGLSIIDILMNCGFEGTKELIMK